MSTDYITAVMIGAAAVIGLAAVCYVAVLYARGQRRAYEKMTPEERKELEVFKRGAMRRR